MFGIQKKIYKSSLTNHDLVVAMGGLLLKLQNFKKVKLIFGHPVHTVRLTPHQAQKCGIVLKTILSDLSQPVLVLFCFSDTQSVLDQVPWLDWPSKIKRNQDWIGFGDHVRETLNSECYSRRSILLNFYLGQNMYQD